MLWAKFEKNLQNLGKIAYRKSIDWPLLKVVWRRRCSI